MKILVISWYFPPGNDIGAVRVGKLAEYLQEQGHDVRVLTGARKHKDESLPIPLPTERILRVPWFDVDRLTPRFWRSKPANKSGAPATPNEMSASLTPSRRARLSDLYMNVLRIPDRQVGWLPYVLRAGKQLLREYPADLIYASGPPFSAFFPAGALAKRFGVPWVAEYRDGWSGDVYTDRPKWREPIDNMLENRAMRTAAAIVTVSEPWAVYYRERFGKPTAAIYNGYDPEDVQDAKNRKVERDRPVSIVHMGAMYGGVRDPSLLYEAIRRAGLRPKDVRVSYYGPSRAAIYPLAMKYGVSDFVTVGNPVPHQRSLKLERESDVLLLLQSPLDPRNVPAKVFEYFAVRRPILGIGLDDGIPAKLIRERKAGFYHSDADALAAQLTRWVKEKRDKGVIANLPAKARAGLSRAEQFRDLEAFLRSVSGARSTTT